MIDDVTTIWEIWRHLGKIIAGEILQDSALTPQSPICELMKFRYRSKVNLHLGILNVLP